MSQRVLIILGNGFDIALGLKTGYKSFYEAFLAHNQSTFNVADGSPHILHPELVNMIEDNKDFDYWSDLELLLGKTVEQFDSIDRLRDEKIFLEEELNDYLRAEQNRLLINEKKSFELKSSIDTMIRRMLDSMRWNPDNRDIEVQFITFNYTDTIDRIINCINKSADAVNQITLSQGKYAIAYKTPLHIHGSIDSGIILGVDNGSQYENLYTDKRIQIIHFNDINKRSSASILNKKDENLRQLMEKPLINSSLRSIETQNIINEIMNSNKIMVFGSSVGLTDSFWWDIIVDWLLSFNKKDQLSHQVCIFAFIRG